jgi:hypothetical protein
MRSTRATAAIARLNARTEGRHYTMPLGSNGLIKLRERVDGSDKELSAALPLDDFVQLADSMGPQKEPRITKSEAAFLKQLVKTPRGITVQLGVEYAGQKGRRAINFPSAPELPLGFHVPMKPDMHAQVREHPKHELGRNEVAVRDVV